MRQDEFNEVKVTNENQNFRYEFTNAQKTEFSFQNENDYKSVSDEQREKPNNEERDAQTNKSENRREEKKEQLKEELNSGGESSSTSSSSSTSGSSSSSGSSSNASSSSGATSTASTVSSTVATAASVVAVSAVAVATGVSVIKNQNVSCTFQELNIFSDRIEYSLVLENNDTDNFNISVTSTDESYESRKKISTGENSGEFIGLSSGAEYRILVQEEGNPSSLYDRVFTTSSVPAEGEVTEFELSKEFDYDTNMFKTMVDYIDHGGALSGFELYLEDITITRLKEEMPEEYPYDNFHTFELAKTKEYQSFAIADTEGLNPYFMDASHIFKYEFSYLKNGVRTPFQRANSFTFNEEPYYNIADFSIVEECAIDSETFGVNLAVSDDDNVLSNFELFIEDLTLTRMKEEMPEEITADTSHTFSLVKENGTQQLKFKDEELNYELRPEDEFRYELSYQVNGKKTVHAQSESFRFKNDAFIEFSSNYQMSDNYSFTYTTNFVGDASNFSNFYIEFTSVDDDTTIIREPLIIDDQENTISLSNVPLKAAQLLKDYSYQKVTGNINGEYFEDEAEEPVIFTLEPDAELVYGFDTQFEIDADYNLYAKVLGQNRTKYQNFALKIMNSSTGGTDLVHFDPTFEDQQISLANMNEQLKEQLFTETFHVALVTLESYESDTITETLWLTDTPITFKEYVADKFMDLIPTNNYQLNENFEFEATLSYTNQHDTFPGFILDVYDTVLNISDSVSVPAYMNQVQSISLANIDSRIKERLGVHPMQLSIRVDSQSSDQEQAIWESEDIEFIPYDDGVEQGSVQSFTMESELVNNQNFNCSVTYTDLNNTITSMSLILTDVTLQRQGATDYEREYALDLTNDTQTFPLSPDGQVSFGVTDNFTYQITYVSEGRRYELYETPQEFTFAKDIDFDFLTMNRISNGYYAGFQMTFSEYSYIYKNFKLTLEDDSTNIKYTYLLDKDQSIQYLCLKDALDTSEDPEIFTTHTFNLTVVADKYDSNDQFIESQVELTNSSNVQFVKENKYEPISLSITDNQISINEFSNPFTATLDLSLDFFDDEQLTNPSNPSSAPIYLYIDAENGTQFKYELSNNSDIQRSGDTKVTLSGTLDLLTGVDGTTYTTSQIKQALQDTECTVSISLGKMSATGGYGEGDKVEMFKTTFNLNISK